ncbi:hypothetical protein J31TS4_42630 [Paenibacillus sp. J31TS4]|uniref:flagellar protein FlgN n=1 Tax=Paenibacillus sp. J31TS4 TaxID=2807195 RepID=UPI001B28B897|nr:flagellar protein FlgN [Paenibacillus sp. J31TS4]GIP40983.1 hypothetical protein J31TS4_42630 [Paenibacillus sp. J31TS4]
MTIQQLTDTMDTMISIQDELLELAAAKTDVLVANDVTELSRITQKETALMKRLAEAEEARRAAVNGIVTQKGYMPSPKITVTELVRFLFKAEDKQEVTNRQRILADKVERLKAVNDKNQELIRASLTYIGHALDLVSGTGADEATYRNPQHQQPGVPGRIHRFDTKA